MEAQEVDSVCCEEANHLNRNRSFKSKQLVRSQAIRESQSPPRPLSPCINNVKHNETHADNASSDNNDSYHAINVEKSFSVDNVESFCVDNVESFCVDNVENNVAVNVATDVDVRALNVSSDDSSLANSDGFVEGHCCDEKKQQVEIQITANSWDDVESVRRRNKCDDRSRDLLSNSPRVACVCGACACTRCRGRRREHACPTKQDSGIVCDADNSDSELTASVRGESIRSSPTEERTHCTMCRCADRPERRHDNSRNDSGEDKSELSGAELVKFIKDTLNKNPRDRVTLLKIERELHDLVNDHGRMGARFPAASSYGRLLVHRVAELFHLTHRLDPATRQAVLVSKSGTSGGQIPCTQFRQWCSATFPEMQHSSGSANTTNAKSILKRATQSLEESGTGSFAANRSKSLQQREKDYERVRSRIFSEDNCRVTDESQWPWLSSGPVKLLTADSGRKLLKVQSLEVAGSWRRGAISKSHSFAGEHQHARVLSTQGSLASSSWRLSPGSSGYKTLSLRSTDSITPSPTGGASPEPTSCGAVVWTHPQTGRVVRNPDGSLYHTDSANYDQTQVDQSNDRRRGRLQKQQSFMDNECECQPPPATECSKCYCECQQRESTAQQYDKPPPQPNQTLHHPPPIPNKTHYSSNIQHPPQPTNHNHDSKTEPTNHKANKTKAETPKKISTNQRPPHDISTNQRPPHDISTNQKPPQDISTNQRPPHDISTNQRPSNDLSTNQRPPSHDIPTNQRPPSREISTNQRPPSYDRAANQKTASDSPANQRPASANNRNKLTNQSSQELQYVSQTIYLPYRSEDLSSPGHVNQVYLQPDVTSLQPAMHKLHPPDQSMRPMFANVIYPTQMPPTYPYMNAYRPEQHIQPAVYQQVSDSKPAPHSGDNGSFRIDPSYPYPAMEYSQCGACHYADNYHTHATQHTHGYGAPYAHVEALPAAYPPLLLPPHCPQYQEQVQWAPAGAPRAVTPKLLLHELYPYCGLVCPPVQSYPVCGAVYNAGADRVQARQHASTRNTPLAYTATDRTVDADRSAPTPQRLSQQMAAASLRETNDGLLGNRPGSGEGSQLSCAARAIVDSIRTMQARATLGAGEGRRSPPRERRRDDKRREYRPPHTAPQVAPANWYKRSPAPVYPVLNHPRRSHPNARNERR